MANDRRVGNLFVQMRAEIGGLKTDIKELDTAFKQGFAGIEKSAASSFAAIGKSLVGAFSVQQILNFTKSIVDLGGRLKDLEEQTGISGQLLSGMKSTIEEGGSSLDAFAKGILIAQRNLGQVDKETDKAAIAIKHLGLNLNDLRNASPEEFLKKTSEALAKVPNQYERAALASALLAKGGAELIPILVKMSGELENMRKKGMNQADIDLLDEVGDAWTRFGNDFVVAASKILAPAFRLIDTFRELTTNIGGILGTGALLGTTKGFRTLTEGVDEAIKALNLPPEKPFRALEGPDTKAAAAAKKQAAEDAARAKQLLEEFQRDIIKAIDEQEKLGIEAGQTILDVFKKMDQAAMDPLEKSIDDINRQFDELIKKITEAGEATGQNFLPAIERLRKLRDIGGIQARLAAQPPGPREAEDIEDEAARVRAIERTKDLDKVFRDLRVTQEQNAISAKLFGDSFNPLQANLNATSKAMQELIATGQELDPRMAGLKTRFEEMTQTQREWQGLESVIRSGFSAIGTAFDGVIQGTQSVGEAFRNMGQSILLSISQAITQILIVEPMIRSLRAALTEDSGGGGGGGIGGIFSKIAGSVLGLVGGIFGGSSYASTVPDFDIMGFQSGGMVPGRIGAPRLAMVHGGETITPPGKSMGKPNVNVTVNGSIIPNPGVTREQVIQIGIDQFNNRRAWTQAYENRRSQG